MGAINRQNPVLLALAVVLAFAICSAHAAGDGDQDTAKDAAKGGQYAKKLALTHLLARAGKNEEAAVRMRSLYPNGPPEGDLALEYYRIIGNTSKGWNKARIGLEKLVKAIPSDTRYRLALARHLTARPATRRSGIQTLAALSRTKQPVADKQQILDAFYVDTDAWKGQIVSQARQAVFQAVAGLCGGAAA